MNIPNRVKYIVKKLSKISNKKIKLIMLLSSSMILSGTYILIKNKTPYIENKPAQVIKAINSKGEEELFLERVGIMRSGIMQIGKIVIGEEKLVLSETFGTSSNNYVEVAGNFRIDYAVDIESLTTVIDNKKKEVTYKIKPSDIKVNSVTLIGDIEETFKHKSFGVKVVDLIPGLNKDEDIKENAIKHLLRNSKIEAEKFNEDELKEEAKKAIMNLINKLNINDELNYKLEFSE